MSTAVGVHIDNIGHAHQHPRAPPDSAGAGCVSDDCGQVVQEGLGLENRQKGQVAADPHLYRVILIPNADRPVAFQPPNADAVTYWSPAPGATAERLEFVRKTVRVTRDASAERPQHS